MIVDIYVSADTEDERYGRAETLARVVEAYADHTYQRQHTVQRVSTATGSWDGVTENVVVLSVEGKTRDIISLMAHMASVLDQECIMAVEYVGTGGNASLEVQRGDNSNWRWGNWTRFDGMGQPKFRFVPDWQYGDHNVWFTDRDGVSTSIGK